MKTMYSYLRVIGYVAIAYILFEFFLGTDAEPAIFKYPIIWAILATVLFFGIAVEIILAALNNVLFRSLNQKEQQSYLHNQLAKEKSSFSWIKRTYKKLLGSKPLEEEHEIVLDHNYDGIRELDNTLPPWWVYLFYATILFSVVYMFRFHIFGGVDQEEEFEIAMEEARLQVEEYKRTAKDLIDVSTVELLTDPGDLASGKSVFEANCAVCHKVDAGGGIGPNLVDDYWISGGGIKNVFNTISEGGRDGKGMVSWKTTLKPSEMAQVASYILSLHGTTPMDPKDPEGELWVDEFAPVEQAEVKIIDSTKIQILIEDEPVTEDIIDDDGN